jgi:hypothetical protein
LIRSRWAAPVVLAAMVVLLTSCSSNTVTLNPTPSLTVVFPDTATAGGKDFVLNLIGTNLISTSQVFWNGSCVLASPGGMNSMCAAVTFNASTQQLTVTIPSIDIATAGSAQITVVNPGTGNPPVGGGTSNSITFPILAANNPVPTITSLLQTSATAGGPSFGLIVNGTNFISTSAVNFNGSPRTTSFNFANQLTAVILAQDLLCPGVAHITVSNPAPGGGTSNAVEFDVTPLNSAQPCITALSPATANAGSAGFPLTVSGTNFNANSTVKFGVNARVTTFNPATGQLTAALLKADLANAGTVNVTVVNTVPVAGTSAPFPFTINLAAASNAGKTDRNTFPQVISISASGGPADGPSSAPAMSADGRYVAFYSEAKNLVAEGASGNIFLRDTCLGATIDCTPRTVAVDLAPDGSAPNGGAAPELSISGDGGFVAFSSAATNLAGNEHLYPEDADQVFVRDFCLGLTALPSCRPHTELVSAASNGLPGARTSGSPSISGDGRCVAFISSAKGLASDGVSNQPGLFVRDTCSTASAAASCSPQTVPVLVLPHPSTDFPLAQNPKISGDGRYVAFELWDRPSYAKWLGMQDTHTPSEILVADTCLGETAPKKCLPSITSASVSAEGGPVYSHNESPSISGDARFVVFQSQSVDSSSGERIGPQHVFLRDTCLGSTAGSGCTSSTLVIRPDVSALPDNQDAFSPSISASGRYIALVMGHVAGTAQFDSPTTGLLFVHDTCLGATSSCLPNADATRAPDADVRSLPFSVDQFTPAPIAPDARFAVFVSAQAIPGLPTSGLGNVFITTTPLNQQ